MSWRDDLPEIPTERIRGQVVREGGARRTAARQRRNTMLTGAGLAAVVVLAVAGIIAVSGPSDDRNGDAADATSPAVTARGPGASPAATSPEATTRRPRRPPTPRRAAETTSGASETTVPFITDVRVDPTTVWEAPVGGTACGPVAFAVTATAPGAQRADRDRAHDGRVAGGTGDGPRRRRWRRRCSTASRPTPWSPAVAPSCSSRWSSRTPAACSTACGPGRRAARLPALTRGVAHPT